METRSIQTGVQVAPHVVALAACFLLAGLGTVVLGPVLPVVAAQWHLSDAQSGSLLFAKFACACLGGLLVAPHLRHSTILGTLLAGAGFAAFALAHGLTSGSLSIAVAGFGLGQLIASNNMLSGLRFPAHVGSGLAALNFFFSLGAVLTGVVAGKLLPLLGLRTMLLSLAALYVLCAAGAALPGTSVHNIVVLEQTRVRRHVILVFGLLLFLYGGLETSLSSWITTYGQRYEAGNLVAGQSALVIFWIALTVGRLLATGLLRFISERNTAVVGVVIAGCGCVALALVQSASITFAAVCIVIGLSTAPFFPAVFGMLMQHGPSPRQAGTALAVSGLGAAFFSWLTGAVSTRAGSLRAGMFVPAALSLALALGTRLPRLTPSQQSSS